MCWFFSFSATFIDVVRALLPGGDMGGGMQGPQGLQLKAERGVGFLGYVTPNGVCSGSRDLFAFG